MVIASYANPVEGTEVHLAPSKAVPGDVNVIIVGPTIDAVQQVIENIAEQYGHGTFLIPAQTNDGAWGTMGRIHG